MDWKRFKLPLLALPIGAALLFVACGGGGGGDGAGDGDGGNDGGSSVLSGASGSDERYVAQMCKALVSFQEGIGKASAEVNPEDYESEGDLDFAKLFGKPMDKLISDMEDADPPKDVKKYHDDAVKQLKDAKKKLDNGDQTAFDSLGGNPIDPPQSIQDRLSAAAAENEDCKNAGISFS